MPGSAKTEHAVELWSERQVLDAGRFLCGADGSEIGGCLIGGRLIVKPIIPWPFDVI